MKTADRRDWFSVTLGVAEALFWAYVLLLAARSILTLL